MLTGIIANVAFRIYSNTGATTKAATARPILMHKEEQIDTIKMPVILTPSKQEHHTISRLHHSLVTEGDCNKVAMAMAPLMVKLLARLQDMVSSTALVYSDSD